jgi:flagellar hook protein FlgE
MSFFTALAGLKGAQADISTTSNNIANVGSNGFKKSRAEFGEPKRTDSISMGVNLSSTDKVLPTDNIFSVDDDTTYSSTSAVTIFDNAGNPQSATVYYLKTQTATDLEPTYKYDTKVFVDGVEIKPQLTRAVDPQEAGLFIDKFGQQTTVPQDPAYILEGKGFPLYKADDLGVPVLSTAAKITGIGQELFLSDGKTIKITTNKLEYKSTMEYQALQGVDSPIPGTFWGKDFLILDFDESGPVSIDIPPGTYNGTQLAEAVEVAARTAFGDDKKVNLKEGVDSFFSLDLKKSKSDGSSAGLATPIKVDLHQTSYVIDGAKADLDGMDMPTLLTHAQVRMNFEMNKYIQGAAERADATVAAALDVEGKMFKKTVGVEMTQVKSADPWDSQPPTGGDIIMLTHLEGDTTKVTATSKSRFVGYNNPAPLTTVDTNSHSDSIHGERNKPTVEAYDYMAPAALTHTGGRMGVDANGYPFIQITVNQAGGSTYSNLTGLSATDLESISLFQYEGKNASGPRLHSLTNILGTQPISIREIADGAEGDGSTFKVTLDFNLDGQTFPPTAYTASVAASTESAINVLLKPSDNVAAYFESSEGLVEGVNEAYYTRSLVIQEIGSSALRFAGDSNTNKLNSLQVVQTVAGQANKTGSGDSLTAFGFRAANGTTAVGATTMNWSDDRDPAIKIGYDEKEQRLTFDGDNAKLGLGTGIQKHSFTVYSKAQTDGSKSDLGIPAFGNNKDISLASDDKFLGESFINDGADVRVQNKRYGMEVYFDTVNNKFDIQSGKTGEQLAENSAVGVTANQSASDVSVGRYKLTNDGSRDATDNADYGSHSIGSGLNRILGFPRAGELGFTGPTGLASKPAVATGTEALVNMNNAFTLTSTNNENKFTIVVDGVNAFLTLPEKNYTGTTLATALESRINQMVHPTSGMPIGGVDVSYNSTTNNLVFTSGTSSSSSTLKIEGDLRFGLKDIPLGIGETAAVKAPRQATDEFGRPLFVSPSGEITARIDEFEDNIVTDFFPLYLDDGELTFNQLGELTSPITKVDYKGASGSNITVDYSDATNFAQPFSAQSVAQDGFAAGRMTNLEINNFGSVIAGYSNGSTVALGKIIIANFTNNSGLKQIGNSTFSATAASGAAELGEAAEDGFGSILSGSLEKSNVDITEELVNLITAQRNYQAAAKAMETTTSMTQTIINIRL